MTSKTDEYGYTLRERMNIYAGMTMGALAPIVGLKYLIGLDNNSLSGEVASWLVSLAINFSPLLVKQPPFPLYGSAVGAAFGMIGANQLRYHREEKEQKKDTCKSKESAKNNDLENVIDVTFKELN